MLDVRLISPEIDVNIYVKKTIQLGGVMCVYDLTFLDVYLVNDGAFFSFYSPCL